MPGQEFSADLIDALAEDLKSKKPNSPPNLAVTAITCAPNGALVIGFADGSLWSVINWFYTSEPAEWKKIK